MNRTEKKRVPVFSVTIADCKVDTFRGSGPGGQNRNKRDTAVRVTHPPSGAVGTATEHKSQLQNKKAAFRRMAESKLFMFWINHKVANTPSIEELMKPENLKIETQDEKGLWHEYTQGLV